jgi:hypothetical protein
MIKGDFYSRPFLFVRRQAIRCGEIDTTPDSTKRRIIFKAQRLTESDYH